MDKNKEETPQIEKFWDPNSRSWKTRRVGQDTDITTRAKFDPRLRREGVKTQEEVEQEGGLAAAARRAKAAREAKEAPRPRPTPEDEDNKKKKKLPADKQISALTGY